MNATKKEEDEEKRKRRTEERGKGGTEGKGKKSRGKTRKESTTHVGDMMTMEERIERKT